MRCLLFIELQGFSKRRQVLLPDDEFRAFQEILINDPEAGDTISGTGGFRKIRWSRPGTGKRGGVRVIYYNVTIKGRIYLALIYPKNEQDGLSQEQKKILRQVAATGLKQQDFAAAVGVSYELVKSWETKRRHPTGASRKLLLLLQGNPLIINLLKVI